MSNLIDLKKRAVEILSREMPKAEAIAKSFQDAWESQWTEIQDTVLEERIESCINKIDTYTKDGDEFKLLQEKHKLGVLLDMANRTSQDRFGNKDFDENSPNLIVDDITDEGT